ncbi:hypothetical protein [Emticicia agri]|uniref:Uncharacterized protein n=1 Tax=Emticicia agri TaxID=2492393 RepID=A0A4Q5LUI3_9BACT|nr:hypothetical protein [Emticicia agri]RYU93341.1 hypothetical protein EWM59_22450 [Emticicia agri]
MKQKAARLKMKKLPLILLILFPLLCKSQNATINKYFDAGIPTLNKSWTAQEYVNAINLLDKLAKEGTLALPSTKNETKDLFFKISNFENYWFFKSEVIGYQDKMTFLLMVQKPLLTLYFTYISSAKEINGVIDYSTEMVSLQLIAIKLTDLQIEYTEKFIVANPNLTKIQQDGLQKMKTGLNTFISGNIATLKDEYIYYLEDDICRLSKVFFDFYRKNRLPIDEISRNEFDKNIKLMGETHKLACVKNLAKL